MSGAISMSSRMVSHENIKRIRDKYKGLTIREKYHVFRLWQREGSFIVCADCGEIVYRPAESLRVWINRSVRCEDCLKRARQAYARRRTKISRTKVSFSLTENEIFSSARDNDLVAKKTRLSTMKGTVS